MNKGLITHNVANSPIVNTEELLGAYRSLFDSLKIKHFLTFPVSIGVETAIKEVNDKLKEDFAQTYLAVKSLLDSSPNGVEVVNIQVAPTMITFVFKLL